MTEAVKCVVCNRAVEKSKALPVSHQGQTLSVCGTNCQYKFSQSPWQFAKSAAKSASSPSAPKTPSSTLSSTPSSTPKKP